MAGTNSGRFDIRRVTSDEIVPRNRSIFDEGVQDDNACRRQSFYKRSPSVDDIQGRNYRKEDDGAVLTLYEDDRQLMDLETDLHSARPKANLGTFLGVFLPCCQNIVGVIFFVRLPWIVGCAGLLEGFLIVGLCCLVSITVAISISAIATNGKVIGGGTYFMISRSLGPAFGGSVGILFFCGTSISVAMYYIGTVETLLIYIEPKLSIFGATGKFSVSYNDCRVYGTILLIMMSTIVFIGITCVQRFGFFAILFLVAAIFSVLTGIFASNDEDSVKVCKMGDRVFRHSMVYHNGTWYCTKAKDGALYKAYCSHGSCENFFTANTPEVIPAIPGIQLRLLKENLYSQYSQTGHLAGSKVKAKDVEVSTDITTSMLILMAIYFPSITGVESGSNYSGDLANPNRSIPVGTMIAVVVTSTLYMSVVVLFAGSVEGPVLRDKYGQSVSYHGELMLSLLAWPSKWVVLIGTLTATIGAGLQALAGGPRLLLAIATDGIFPFLNCFAKTWRGEPSRCLSVTFCIALSGILIAKLDYVAPIVTMFFLMCYGFINFAVALQSLLDLPHWRPSFKCYHWSVALLGTALCIVIMFMSNWIYAVVAILLAFFLYQYIEYKGAEKEWGDGMTGLSMSAAIYALGRLKQDYHHIKNWRPQLLVLMKPRENETNEFCLENRYLVRLSTMMQMGKGLTVYGSVIQGNLSEHAEEIDSYKKLYRRKLDNVGAKGFVDIVVSPNVSEALSCVMQCSGLGPLHPNTVIIGWPEDWIAKRNISSYNLFIDTMRNAAFCRNAAIVLKARNLPLITDRLDGTIDIWWIVNDGGMLLLMAYLLKRNKTWSRCRVRVFTVAEQNENTVLIEKNLKKYLLDLRLDCELQVVEMMSEDISAYVYERTMKLEERARMLAYLSKQKGGRVRDSGFHIMDPATQSKHKLSVKSKDFNPMNGPGSSFPSEKNVRHMQTALTLNKLLKQKSTVANLIILNLPTVPEKTTAQANYMSFLEVLTERVDNLLLVRGTGSEVITIFN